MPAERDPVSVLFDRGARILLERAYARPGQWVGTRIAFPSPRHVAHFATLGINVLGTDHLGRDRWVAGFIRSVYWLNKWHFTKSGYRAERRTTYNEGRAVQYELGRRMPVLGIIPAGRAVRIRTRPGGQAARNAARKMPDSKRIYTDDKQPGERFSDPNDRDW